jgi:leucyl aminopeptidase
MSQSYWFYSPVTQHRRTLLLQHSQKPDAKLEDVRKSIRGLGAKAAQEFQGKKCDDVEIIFSDKIEKELQGVFANSFELTNYEYSHKTAPEVDEEAEKKAKAEPDYDARGKKHGKVIGKVEIRNSKENVLESSDHKFWVASARATAYARNLTNTRGSIATPDYMED